MYVNTLHPFFSPLPGGLAPSCLDPLYALRCVLLVYSWQTKKNWGLTPPFFGFLLVAPCRPLSGY